MQWKKQLFSFLQYILSHGNNFGNQQPARNFVCTTSDSTTFICVWVSISWFLFLHGRVQSGLDRPKGGALNILSADAASFVLDLGIEFDESFVWFFPVIKKFYILRDIPPIVRLSHFASSHILIQYQNVLCAILAVYRVVLNIMQT